MINYLLNHIEAFKVALRRLFYAKAASLVMFLIIGITTCLPMSALLFLENIKQASLQIEYSAEISIFLINEYKDDDLKTFTSFLKEQPIVSKITFEKKEDAWVKLQKKIMIDGDSLIEKNPLPDSFYLSLATLDENEIDYLVKELKEFAIIDDVLLDSAWVNKLNSILSLGELIINFLGILLLSVLAVIIGNTIRLQALSFKDEIEVSKLIGASNGFISSCKFDRSEPGAQVVPEFFKFDQLEQGGFIDPEDGSLRLEFAIKSNFKVLEKEHKKIV